MAYETVIGIEIHAELSTKTKAFCACEYSFGGEVNTQCCPGCAGLPGALPVLNKSVVDYTLRIGLAANCHINQKSGFDRKNYFYPDLAIGYQKTQFNTPLCQNGHIEFYHRGEKKKVRIKCIHMEEDTAKLLHGDNFRGTLLDFNRSGVPLVEIVSEPDLRSAEEAKDYLENVRMLLKTLDVCNCKMQEGVIRCDINVSVRPAGQEGYGTRVEMKNVNTFNGAVQAIEYEAGRQIAAIEGGGQIVQETRRWDEARGESAPMRAKEGAADYRYFPEPDLSPVIISDEWLNDARASLPELPVATYERYRGMGLTDAESWAFVENPDKAAYFGACADIGGISLKLAANWIFGEISAHLNKHSISIADCAVTPEALCEMIGMIESGEISNEAGKRIIYELFVNEQFVHEKFVREKFVNELLVGENLAGGGSPRSIVERLGLKQDSDEAYLRQLVAGVLDANKQQVEAYRNGKTNIWGYLVGQCMKASSSKGNPQVINALLKELLGEN